MPWGLERFHQPGQTHFVTFCCYPRQAGFLTAEAKRTFQLAVERVRRSFGLCIYGYVVMPEHVHLLLSEPQRESLAHAIKSLKQGVKAAYVKLRNTIWELPSSMATLLCGRTIPSW